MKKRGERLWYNIQLTNCTNRAVWGVFGEKGQPECRRYSSLGTGCCSLRENKTSQQHNKNNVRTTDQGQHISDRQSGGEGFSNLIRLQVKPGSNIT